MTLKQKALLRTVSMLATAVAGSVSVAYLISVLTINTFLTILGVGFVAYMCYIVYCINLSQLEYREKLQETVDQIRR